MHCITRPLQAIVIIAQANLSRMTAVLAAGGAVQRVAQTILLTDLVNKV